MRTYWSCLSAFLLFMLSAIPVQAQASRTWVSGVGDDAEIPVAERPPAKLSRALSRRRPQEEKSMLWIQLASGH